MTAASYFADARALTDHIEAVSGDSIRQAAELMADGVAKGGLISLFGSGHSILPVMDAFPRYGSYPAFRPLTDVRLSWFNVLGTGGVRELLWLERTEGYIANFLDNYPFADGDTLVVYSHGGLNAAGIDASLYARERGVQGGGHHVGPEPGPEQGEPLVGQAARGGRGHRHRQRLRAA